MKVEDAIYNWLQIAVVAEGRPEDMAAQETADFFRGILRDDHNVKEIRYERDSFKYTVYYQINDKEETKIYDLMLIDKLLEDIEKEPKYNKD